MPEITQSHIVAFLFYTCFGFYSIFTKTFDILLDVFAQTFSPGGPSRAVIRKSVENKLQVFFVILCLIFLVNST